MQDLYEARAYPKELHSLITQTRMGIELANRWMLGWPDRIQAMIATGEYQVAFESQLALEIEAEANASQYNHLSSWEKREVLGLSESP